MLFDTPLHTFWRDAKKAAEKHYADAIKREWIDENPGETPPPYPLNFDWGLGDVLDGYVKQFQKLEKLTAKGANVDSPEAVALVKDLSNTKRQLVGFLKEYKQRVEKAEPILADVSADTVKTLHRALQSLAEQLDMMKPGDASGFKQLAARAKRQHDDWRKAKVASKERWDEAFRNEAQAGWLKAMGFRKYPFDVRAGVGPGLEKAAKAILKLDMAGYKKAMADASKAAAQVGHVFMKLKSAARDLKEPGALELVEAIYEPLADEIRSINTK